MLSDEELLCVKGGAASGAIIEAITKLMDAIFNYGRSLGSSIKRIITKNYCQ